MSAAQLFLPASRAFNSNGLPVAGAVIKLYTTGTLVPQPMYSDSALTVSLGSSVAANAAGRFDTIYQDNATPFRLRIEDASGAELDDIDPFYFGQMDVSLDTIYPAALGTLADMPTLTIPTGIDIVSTTGADVLDHGGGTYVAGAAPTAGSGFTSANSRNFVLSKEQIINPRMFFRATDPSFSAAMDRSVAYISALGSGAMWIPKDSYTLTTYLALCHKLRIFGDGPTSSIFTSAHAGGGGADAFENLRNGSSFTSIDPVNVSTAADITLEDIGIFNTNASSQGAAFFQRGGSFVNLKRVVMRGHRFGGVYSQTELLTTEDCRYEAQVNNGAGEWYINGNDLGDGATGAATNNAISIRPQYNQLTGIPDLIHDGGYNYTTINPNFNGGLRAARFAGVVGLMVVNPAVESMDQDPFLFDATGYYSAAGVGSCAGEFRGGVVSAVSGFGCFKFQSGGTIHIGGGITLATPTGASIRGSGNIFALELGSVSTTYAGDTLVDGWTTNAMRPALYLAAAPTTGFHRAGEVVFPQASVAGSVLFWRCVVDGTPGTWEAFGARQTGWTAATGTPLRGAFAATAAGTVSAAYVQAEAQASRDRIAALEARFIALEADARTYRIIDG